jgi:translation initiation factor IF-3
MQHPELGRNILDRIAEEVVDVGKVEVMPKQDGRNMTMVLGPDRQAQSRKAREDAKAEVATEVVADGSGSTETPETEATKES